MGKHGECSVIFSLNVPLKKKKRKGTSYGLTGELLDRNGESHVCRFRTSFQ